MSKLPFSMFFFFSFSFFSFFPPLLFFSFPFPFFSSYPYPFGRLPHSGPQRHLLPVTAGGRLLLWSLPAAAPTTSSRGPSPRSPPPSSSRGPSPWPPPALSSPGRHRPLLPLIPWRRRAPPPPRAPPSPSLAARLGRAAAVAPCPVCGGAAPPRP